MKIFSALLLTVLLLSMGIPLFANPPMGMGNPRNAFSNRGVQTFDTRFIPQGVNPSLFTPGQSLYYWKTDDPWINSPCYYDERYGVWVGPCNASLDTPGYSITVPRTIRR
ncbi:MAG: hypothetical protein U1F57_07915 [bacterium]